MNNISTTLIRAVDTHRLIPTKFAEPLIFQDLADSSEEVEDLYALESLTNQRLRAEENLNAGIGSDELVFGVPNFRVINAAFAYARPIGSRFNSPERGAWYCSLEFETAMAEVIFHKESEFAEINYTKARSVRYRDLLSDFSAQLHDLRSSKFKKYSSKESFLDSQGLAEELLSEGSLGVIYPSARKEKGTNIAAFRPQIVGNVRVDKTYEVSWESGKSSPIIKEERD